MTDPRGCLWPLLVSSRGWSVLLEPKIGITGPLKLAGTPSNFLGVAWNPELDTPNAQSIVNVPKLHFRCIRG